MPPPPRYPLSGFGCRGLAPREVVTGWGLVPVPGEIRGRDRLPVSLAEWERVRSARCHEKCRPVCAKRLGLFGRVPAPFSGILALPFGEKCRPVFAKSGRQHVRAVAGVRRVCVGERLRSESRPSC